jgi:hypothetical protein
MTIFFLSCRSSKIVSLLKYIKYTLWSVVAVKKKRHDVIFLTPRCLRKKFSNGFVLHSKMPTPGGGCWAPVRQASPWHLRKLGCLKYCLLSVVKSALEPTTDSDLKYILCHYICMLLLIHQGQRTSQKWFLSSVSELYKGRMLIHHISIGATY